MMEQNPARPARKVAIADHLWDAYEDMAEAMGSDRDALINQAMFMFARLNGFLEAQSAASGRAPVKSAAPVLAPVASRPPVPDAMTPAPASLRRGSSDSEDRKEVAERVLETAAELERLIKGNRRDEDEEPEDDSSAGVVDDLPPEDDYSAEPQHDEDQELDEEAAPEPGQLYLVTENGELEAIAKERFVIGRGKHCDLVINSGKVSREHAVILTENDEFFIEDLGSSNGTWFNKQRIKRRRVEDGDEYFICSEKVKLVIR